MGSPSERGRPRRRILDVLGAACAAVLAFTAVPAVLVVVVGNPLADGLGHAWRPLPRDVLCLLVVAAWVAWAACCAQLLRAVVAHVRRGDVGASLGSSVLDRLAARIAVGVLALSALGAPMALAGGAGASTPDTARPTSAISVTLGGRTSSALAPTAGPTYAVQRGDTLWRIAEDQLGDGADWTSIAALNLGRDVGGGERFVDPDQLREGWGLRLPDDAQASDRSSGRAATDAPGRDHAPGGQPSRSRHLPELLGLGLGSVACAALARRAAARRRLGARFDGDAMFQPDITATLDAASLDTATLDAATLVQRFAGVPALHSFEAANCLLGQLLAGSPASPTARAICVSSTGVTFWFAEAPAQGPPEGFVRLGEGCAWTVQHAALEDVEPSLPHLPVVLPIGDDAAGTWLVPLHPGQVLPVLGEDAPALWRSARAAVTCWTWSEAIVVSEDPDDPRFRAEAAADPLVARRLLYCGNPTALPSAVAARCAVVTMDPVAASDLSILVDRRGATLHPMGQVVRPHLLSTDTAAHIAELVGPPTDDDPTPAPAPAPALAPAVPPVAPAIRPSPQQGRQRRGTDALAPGVIDVRLLTMTPRLDGLHEPLPPNRARRAVELVAYLALHGADVVTSDRLRTRVLGSSDADAASKTLFNTAYAARRAMGVDEQGEPLFPTGTRHGLYQVSAQVTVDVDRAVAFAAAGKADPSPSNAIAYYRAALTLVEGEPLANALSGYAWWEAEGHGGRIAAVLVDAACAMAPLCSDGGFFALGRWGLEQARIVEPYSEALSRSAMQLAAAEGDADRLRLEWRECQRRIDALDPGGSPSARTESLYGELSRRVLVGAAPERATGQAGTDTT